MIRYENECVSCPPELGCRGRSCPNRNVPHFFCDECMDELYSDELYDVGDGQMLCESCALKKIKAPAERWCN